MLESWFEDRSWPLRGMVQEIKIYRRRSLDRALNRQVIEAIKLRRKVSQKQRKELSCS